MTTPNMLLPNPSPGVTVSPIWAQDISDSLDIIDAHDHTSGSGVQVPTAGLNINAALDFQSNDAFNLRTSRYANQGSTPAGVTDLRIVYVKNNELCYRDALGQEVQLTLNGTINVSAGVGVISGLVSPASASYSAITESFSWLKDTNEPAKMLVSDLVIHEFNDPAALPITIKADSVVSAYDIVLPVQLPGPSDPDGVLTIDSAGVASFDNPVPFVRNQARTFELNDGITGASQDKIIYSAPMNSTYVNVGPSITACELKFDYVDAGRWIRLKLIRDPATIGLGNSGLTYTAPASAIFFDIEYSANLDPYLGTGYFIQRNGTITGSQINVATSDFYFNASVAGEYRFRLKPFIDFAGAVAVSNTVLVAEVL